MNPAETVLRNDALVMSRMKAGSVDAFDELYERYCDRAYRVARSVCHDEWRAEDAVQEAFLAVWRNRAVYHPQRGSVAAWLLTTVRYRAIDVARRDHTHASRRAHESTLDNRSMPGSSVATLGMSLADASRLRALLAQLPDAQREVITLAFYGELSHSEIAATLQLPPGTVKGRMRLGLKKLRTTIELLDAAA
jgi:RNA polymerase sigma-70 factor (ECF subfamily)